MACRSSVDFLKRSAENTKPLIIMSHPAGECTCGRKIHIPKSARNGYRWKCRQCNLTWTVGIEGQQLYSHKSKPPKYTETKTQIREGSGGGSDWSWILWLIVGGCALFALLPVISAVLSGLESLLVFAMQAGLLLLMLGGIAVAASLFNK